MPTVRALMFDQAGGPVLRQLVLIGTTLIAVAGSAFGQAQCDAVGPTRIRACVYPGEGPTLVLAAGTGQDSRTWSPIVQQLHALGRVVTFDRPGLGLSPAGDGPRTPTTIARELRQVLSSLDLLGPIVLIGHSMGGVHALRYSDLFPGDVAGVVLLDTPPPGFERDRLELLSAREREDRQRALEEGRTRAPAVVGQERDGAAAEQWEFDRFPRERPLIVVVADRQDFGEVGSLEAHRSLWMRRSSEWLDLSANAELVIAGGSGHMVHHDRPQLVVEVVTRLIDRVY
ncbi:MAG: alpha/beta hydrolase [Deltaproteobacteria bacterium]|nr:alpha/beta hydrolase [Deltaproteobacteria bacterium]